MSGDIEWNYIVHKHEHQGVPKGVYCTKPWSALCQSERRALDEHVWITRVCHGSEHTTQAEALAALERHVRAGACDPERDLWDVPCTGTIGEQPL